MGLWKSGPVLLDLVSNEAPRGVLRGYAALLDLVCVLLHHLQHLQSPPGRQGILHNNDFWHQLASLVTDVLG